MIVFYKKGNGKIVGVIEGRLHSTDHRRMWIGNKNDTNRIVVQWVPAGTEEKEIEKDVEIGEAFDDEGFSIPIIKKVKEKVKVTEFEPSIDDNEQKGIFIELDKNPASVYDFYVDIVTKKLVKKDKQL